MNNPANTKASGQSGNELIAHHMWCGGREREKTLSTAVAGPQIAGERPRVGYRGLANQFPVGRVVEVDGIESEEPVLRDENGVLRNFLH